MNRKSKSSKKEQPLEAKKRGQQTPERQGTRVLLPTQSNRTIAVQRDAVTGMRISLAAAYSTSAMPERTPKRLADE